MKISKKNLMLIIENFLIESEEDRQAMRDLILKGFKSSRKDIKKQEILKMMQDYGMFANPEAMQRGQFGIDYDDYTTPEGIKAKDLRRKPKRVWNKFADHNFFKNKIAKLHQLGYAGGHGSDTLSTSYLKGGNAELSAWGVKSDSPLQPTPEEIHTCANPENYDQSFDNFYIVLDGRVTWAGDFDAYTEELGTHKGGGSTRDIAKQKTKSSGMPKRPGGLNLYDDMEKNLKDFPVLLDEEDVDALPDSRIDEMIVDNWNIITLTYFTSSEIVSLKDKSVDELADWCNKFKEDKKRNSPYHKLKIGFNDGYPNPRVCDYLLGRYWTDSEVRSLFEKLK